MAKSKKGRAATTRAEQILRPTALLGGAVLLSIVLLAAGILVYLSENEWASLATVDGQTITRAAVRDRETVLEFLYKEQAEAVDSLRQQDRISAGEAAALSGGLAEALANVHTTAIDQLIDEKLVRDYRSEESLPVGQHNVGEELARARWALTERRVSYLRLAWQPSMATAGPPESAVPDAVALAALGRELREALTTQDRDTVGEQYRALGWFVVAETRWLASDGSLPGLDPEVIAEARGLEHGGGSTVVGIGWVAVLDVLDVAPEPVVFAQQMLADARAERVPDGALQAWALSLAERRAVVDSLLVAWSTVPAPSVRAAEVVLGPARPQGPSGPWVELSHLVVADVPGNQVPTGDGTNAERIAQYLRGLDPPAARVAFEDLTDAANTTLSRSGPLTYFVKEQLRPELAAVAFAEGVRAGSVLGPLQTEHGEELFLVVRRYDGPLDDRSIGALIELECGTTSPFDIASSLSPATAARAVSGPWRAAAEFPAGSASSAGLFDTPIGEVTGPVVIGDELVAARILEQRSATAAPDALARLRVNGLATWLDGERNAATITYIATATPSASVVPTRLPTPLGIPTPRLPISP